MCHEVFAKMLKWSKQSRRKNGAMSPSLPAKQGGASESHKTKIFVTQDSKSSNSSDAKISISMAEKESALEEARKKFSAQTSSDSTMSNPTSKELLDTHLDTISNSIQRCSVDNKDTNNGSAVNSTRFDKDNNNLILSTLERRSKAGALKVPASCHSNSSTLERGGAKSKYHSTVHTIVDVFISCICK